MVVQSSNFLENSSYVRTLKIFQKNFNKCCFSADMAGNFGIFGLQGRKWVPQIFTFWALNRPFLGKFLTFFFPERFLTYYITKTFFGVRGPFFTFLNDFCRKKYWIFSKKQNLKEFIAKNDLEKNFFFEKSDFSFLWILVKNDFWVKN